MDTQNWIEFIVPIIGVIVVAISADESRLKEKYYLNYIEAISNILVSNNSENHYRSTSKTNDFS